MSSKDVYYAVIGIFWLTLVILFPSHFISLAQFLIDSAHDLAFWLSQR